MVKYNSSNSAMQINGITSKSFIENFSPMYSDSGSQADVTIMRKSRMLNEYDSGAYVKLPQISNR